MKKSFALLLGAAILAVSPARAEMKDALADCTKFVDGWKAAYNAKNADALAGMYDASKGTYSNVFWTGTGHDVLVQGFKQELGMGSSMTAIKCDEATLNGDMGVSKGTWSAMAKGPDGKDGMIGGHWLSTFEAKDGKFFILTHVSNMQLPPPGAPK